METRPVKWQRIVRLHYTKEYNKLSANDKDSEVICYIVNWREHQTGIVVTVEYLDTGLDLIDGDNRDTRQETYLISWRKAAELALELQNKPPRKQQANKGG